MSWEKIVKWVHTYACRHKSLTRNLFQVAKSCAPCFMHFQSSSEFRGVEWLNRDASYGSDMFPIGAGRHAFQYTAVVFY